MKHGNKQKHKSVKTANKKNNRNNIKHNSEIQIKKIKP